MSLNIATIAKTMLLASLITLAGCEEASFTQPGRRIPAERPDVKVERFPLSSTQTRIVDMVWVIDNSGSMADEIELVRQNFGTFVQSIAQISDLNLGLVTADRTQDQGYGIDLHFLAPNIPSRQFSHDVGSTNALSMLAAGVCDASTTMIAESYGTPSTVCSNTIDGYLEGRRDVGAFAGQLRPFFRENSKKVFVVVTDDNAAGIDETNFLNIVRNQLPQQEVYLFGFVGLTDGSRQAGMPGANGAATRDCSVAEVGNAYIQLASTTNGMAFDICEADWSSHFQQLTRNVENIINTEFVLNTNRAFALQEILVDGRLLPEGSFNVQNNRIVVLDRTLLQGAQVLEVRYTVPRN